MQETALSNIPCLATNQGWDIELCSPCNGERNLQQHSYWNFLDASVITWNANVSRNAGWLIFLKLFWRANEINIDIKNIIDIDIDIGIDIYIDIDIDIDNWWLSGKWHSQLCWLYNWPLGQAES